MTPTCHAALLLGLGVLSFSASARAQPAPALRAEREVVLTGGPGEEAPVVYGAADCPLTLVFDVPPRKEGLALADADVRPHPFLAGAVLLTPSSTLAARGTVPLTVPLVDGASVALTLAFKPDLADGRVRIVRKDAPSAQVVARLEEVRAERDEALRVAASAVFGGARDKCNSVGNVVLERVEWVRGDVSAPLVCASGVLTYVRAPAACASQGVRVLRPGGEPVEVLYSEVICPPGEPCDTLLVVRSPAPQVPPDVALELLGKDGAICARFPGVSLRSETR